MSDFKEFPKKMRHPEYRSAVFEQLPCDCRDKNKCNCRTGLFAKDTIMKSPERFPEVTVMTIDQEKQYASRGYRPNNMANAEEYEQAILESSPVSGYRFIEYPKFKYHAFDIPKIVNSKAEEDDLGKGWSDTPILATEDDLDEEIQSTSPQQDADFSPVEVTQKTSAAKKPAPARKTASKTSAKQKSKASSKHEHA